MCGFNASDTQVAAQIDFSSSYSLQHGSIDVQWRYDWIRTHLRGFEVGLCFSVTELGTRVAQSEIGFPA